MNKKLNYINKTITNGREKHAFQQALGITLGIGIGNIFLGNFISWLFLGAWTTFLVIFIVVYAFWPITLKKLKKKAKEIQYTHTLEAPAPRWGYVLTAGLVALVLAMPTIFKENISKHVANAVIQAYDEAEVAYTVKTKTNEEIPLKIPALYPVFEHNNGGWEQKTGRCYKYKWFKSIADDYANCAPQTITFTALLEDMKPLPLATENFSSTQRHQRAPDHHPEIVAVEIRQHWNGEQAEKLIETLASPVEVKARTAPPETTDGLMLETVDGYINFADRKRIVRQIKYAVPVNESTHVKHIICEIGDEPCVMIVDIKPFSSSLVYFHSSHISEWQSIADKAEKLVQRFIVTGND